MAELSRRKLLAAAPLITPLAVGMVAASLPDPSAPHPDAHLLQLGAGFDAALSYWVEAEDALDAAHALFHTTMLARPADATNTEALLRIREETGLTAAREAARATASACDHFSDQMHDEPAQTLDGVLVKLRAIAFHLGQTREMRYPWHEMSKDGRLYLSLTRDVESMAAATGGRNV
ncbi:hypothetical protein J2X65_004289 [Ancylobacter sp. 3268]|uniref:hypothetical protein n=1 Tax=Ancylobacter sp. 3268 TaxID=2817752 RepID=UPI002862C305|nr:hypothetical protein [Ancylobacter sp. 3268]MDR6954913.1 hypothetical protein [Ancylobacter sp. 3268]